MINDPTKWTKHIPLFASWIDKMNSPYNKYYKYNIPYEFKLLYRSSRDGFNAPSFHKNCDNKGATIWVAKIQDSTLLIGGYNPLDWNGKNISTAKLGYVIDTSSAIYCYNDCGPYMGSLSCQSSNESL
ncbi:hypothetical protein C1646_767372 [Rhizophagus diaphanus]|nr:hypothetical protein C1646_767372 [Rhizophagus diaphanus] [Rhizophagus sp. MUCL 43196]